MLILGLKEVNLSFCCPVEDKRPYVITLSHLFCIYNLVIFKLTAWDSPRSIFILT